LIGSYIRRLVREPLVRNVLALYVIRGLNYVTPLFVLPFVLRVLKPNAYGLIIWAQSLMGYAVLLTDFGFNLTAARDISVARNDPHKLAVVYWSTTTAKLILFAVGMACMAVIVFCVPAFRRNWDVFAASSALAVGSVAFPQWYFQGLERLANAAMAQSIAKIVLAIATIALVRNSKDVWIAALLLSSPQLAGALATAAMPRTLKAPPFYRPSFQDVVNTIKGSAYMFGSTLATTLYGYTTALVLGFISGTQAVGLYNLGTKFVSSLQSLATPVTQSIYPRVALLFSQNPPRAWRLLRRTAILLFVAVGLVATGLAIFAPKILLMFAGPNYVGASSVLRITAYTAVIISAIGVPCQMVIVSARLTRQLVRIYLAAGVLNVVLLFLLVPRWAANGAAIGLSVAESTAVYLIARLVWRQRAALGYDEGAQAQ